MVGLDVLRFVAVSLVLLHHYYAPETFPGIFRKLVALWQRGGWIGVDLFFALSGFLVSNLLFQEHIQFGTIKVGRFLIRRGLKIYPSFWLLLAVGTAAAAMNGTFDLHATLAELSFLQNYFPGIFDHTWSLAVEEHFYLLLAIYIMVWTRFSRSATLDKLPWQLLGASVVIVAFRIIYCAMGMHGFRPAFSASHLRLDALMAGVILSYYYSYKREWLAGLVIKHKLLLGVLAAVAFAFGFGCDRNWPVAHTIGFSVLSLGFCALLLLVLLTKCSFSGLISRLIQGMAAVGSYSYSIYLWHRFAQQGSFYLTRRCWHAPWVADFLVYCFFCLAIGTITAKLVEIPVLRFRDRCFPSPKP